MNEQLENRIEALEQQLKNTRKLLVVCLVLPAALALMGANERKIHDEIVTRKLTLVRADGMPSIMMNPGENSTPGIAFFTKWGGEAPSVTLGANEQGGSFLALYNKQGSVLLNSEPGKGQPGDSVIGIFDKNDRARIRIVDGIKAHGPKLEVINSAGKAHWSTPAVK